MKTLIFAGGNGTRLWPLSRVSAPKQFQKLIDNKSLFELTIDRLKGEYSLDDMYVVIPEIYKKNVKEILPEIKDENIIIEPCRWDTLACIGYAAFYVKNLFPNENIFITWSDISIKNNEQFLKIIRVGNKYAEENNKIIQIGAKANTPNINFGYIKIADEISNIEGIKLYNFSEFIEKPDLNTAKKFVESYEYLWNMGLMIWPLEKIVNSYKEFSPETYEILEKITMPEFAGDITEEYKKIKKISFDYEIIQKINMNDIVAVPTDVGWSDVGTWESLKRQLENDESENVLIGNLKKAFFIETKDTISYSKNDQKTICIVGLNNVAVIDTDDALLVCSKDDANSLKKLVETLNVEDPDLC